MELERKGFSPILGHLLVFSTGFLGFLNVSVSFFGDLGFFRGLSRVFNVSRCLKLRHQVAGTRA